jgi:EAL domain-containing protein (putative c-di-GMP-specific phosphodiesterase class I)
LTPDRFLPAATKPQLERLTEIALLAALRDWSLLDRAGCGLRLAVNVPVSALISLPLATLIRECRPSSGDWPGLIMEITESEAAEDPALVAEVALQLRLSGAHLAIDDFGSGFSSFARLKQLPFSELKVDLRFVQGCASDRMNAAICRSAILLARTAGATAVAEGVETEADAEALAAMGCDTAQGYLFGRPAGVGALIERVR